jgi:hypothetical protein
MKRNFKILMIAGLLILTSMQSKAQGPPPHPGDPTGGGTVVGGGTPPAGAPIGNGTFILLTLAAAYAGRKVYIFRNQQVATQE